MNVLIKQHRVHLTTSLGRGGAGTVYAHPSNPKLAIKIYEKPAQDCEPERIDALCTLPPVQLWERGQPTFAWPLDMVYDAASGDACGFSMPRIKYTVPFSSIAHPSARLIRFSRSWLWQTAISFLKRIHSLHLHTPPHIIGDINFENFHVSRYALVTQLDIDSTHFTAPSGTTFTTRMHRWEFQPPELMDAQLPYLDRDQDQDAWSAFTMVNRLICEGEHPFDFAYHGPGNRPGLAEVIRQGIWSHSLRHPHFRPKQSQHSLTTLPNSLQELFRRMFLDGHTDRSARPNVTELLSCLVQHQLLSGFLKGRPSRIAWNRQLQRVCAGHQLVARAAETVKRHKVKIGVAGMLALGYAAETFQKNIPLATPPAVTSLHTSPAPQTKAFTEMPTAVESAPIAPVKPRTTLLPTPQLWREASDNSP